MNIIYLLIRRYYTYLLITSGIVYIEFMKQNLRLAAIHVPIQVVQLNPDTTLQLELNLDHKTHP